MWLLAGIKLDTFKVADYNVDGLYIKLDKKLTLKADNVIIPQSKSDPSFKNVQETLERVKYVLTFFDYIELKNIAFDNNKFSIIFSDDYLLVNSKDYRISGNIRREGKMLKATIPLLTLKEHNLTVSGKFTYDLHEHILATQGQFIFNDITGEFNASKKEDKINFALKSNIFTDLKPIISKFDLEESVRSWVLGKVEAKSYRLLSLSGKGTIKNKQFKMDLDALEGKALFTETKIHFKENVEPVLAPSFILTYENDGLYFDLDAPTYKGKSLEGSKVSIVNMLDPDTTLKLVIKFDTPFDKTIQNLLEAYDIPVPVMQKSGKVNGVFLSDIALKQDHITAIADVNFSKGDVWIDKVKLPIVKGKLHYEDGFITLKDIHLKDTQYEGKIDGKIDLQKKKADLVFDAKIIQFGDEKEKSFVLENQTLPFVLAYGEKIDIVFPKLYARLTNDKGETIISLSDLNKIKPYLSNPWPIEEGGNVDIETKDFETYTFDGVLKTTSCMLYEKEDQCKTRVPFQGKVSSKDLDFYAFDKRLHYNKAKSRLQLNNLNIDFDKFYKTRDKAQTIQSEKLLILGKNSNFRYGEYSLLMDSYDIDIKPNGNIKAIGSSAGDIIKYAVDKGIVSIQALRIKDNVLHPLINFKGLQNGRYSLKASGNPEETMKGEIIVEGGVMKDFKAYNNTLAFINTIPALASLQRPGYSVEGFTIEEGVAEYRMIKKDKIVFDSIYIKGTSATIAGRGEIDLEKKTINLDLAIQTARKLSKVVGNLPVVGYILLGKDKTMTIGLQITGTLDDPKVNTSAGGDILTLPLQILKRTLESPGHIINKSE